MATYWVSPTGAAANWAAAQSATPLSGTNCASLTTFRTGAVSPGDTVYFRGGAYNYDTNSSLIAPSQSGTAGARISYLAYADEIPVITYINAGTLAYEVSLNGRSYISVRGFTFINFFRHVSIVNGSNYNEIGYCDISKTIPGVSGKDVLIGIHINGSTSGVNVPSTHNWIHHNKIHDIYLPAPGEGGDAIKIGDVFNTNVDSNYNTIEYNEIYNIGHACTDNFCRFNVFRGNIVHNPGFKSFTPNLTGTATGGSSTKLIDTTKNFSALGVMTGTFLYVHNLSQPGNGKAYRALITSISTTTNLNDTLNFSTGTGTPTFVAGNNYSIGPAVFADENPPGHGMYSHRGLAVDSQAGQRISAFADCLLIEKNRSGYAASNPANDGAEGFTLSAGQSILRYNSIYGCAGAGIYFKNGIVSSNNRVYNNTIVSNGRFSATQFPSNPIETTGIQLTATSGYNKLLNNIIYGNGGGDFNATIPATWTALSNHLNADGDPKFYDLDLTQESSLTLPDLQLDGASTCIRSGTNLTTTVGAGSNSTSLIVVDSLFFQDGSWGSSLSDIRPDWIAIGNTGNIVEIASIDYTTNTITLANPISWSNGDSVWLYKDSSGETVIFAGLPNIGSGAPSIIPPSNLTATTISTSAINLAWTNNSDNETGFEIERSLNGSSNWVQIATVGADVVSYGDTGLAASTPYYYRVRAYNDQGNSAYSANANATTNALPVLGAGAYVNVGGTEMLF